MEIILLEEIAPIFPLEEQITVTFLVPPQPVDMWIFLGQVSKDSELLKVRGPCSG